MSERREMDIERQKERDKCRGIGQKEKKICQRHDTRKRCSTVGKRKEREKLHV